MNIVRIIHIQSYTGESLFFIKKSNLMGKIPNYSLIESKLNKIIIISSVSKI